MQTQDNTETCYQKGNRNTQQKSLFAALQAKIDSLVNKLDYRNIKETLQA